MAIHDAGMFIVREINRLKVLQDLIDLNLYPARLRRCSALRHVIAADCLKHHRQLGPLGMNNQCGHFNLAIKRTFKNSPSIYCNCNILMSILSHLVMSPFLA